MRVNILVLIAVFLAGTATSQRTSVYTHKDAQHDKGMQLYDAKVYSASSEVLGDYVEYNAPVYEIEDPVLKNDADFARVQTAIRTDRPDAEKQILDFIDRHSPDPIATAALVEVADYYFASREYDKAIEYYTRVDPQSISAERREEAQFNMGYAHFVTKDFERAEQLLGSLTRKSDSQFFEQANYYTGMCRFMQQDYDGAVSCFKRVADTDRYRKYVPYYTAMLYFAVSDYENVISGSEPALQAGKVFKDNDTRQLVGRAYFELGQYDRALPYLEHYEKNASKLSADEFYQLAYAQYQSGNCEDAAKNFKQIASLESPMGQRANFYIADCDLRNGNLQEARNAFKGVAKMNFDPELSEEAQFNFGKLSAQLNFDKEAIQALDSFKEGSQYYSESQNVLDDIFTYTQDYATAISNLEELESLSPKLKAAYQRLNLYYGLQSMQDGDLSSAKVAFTKAETYSIKPEFTAQALFWRGEIAHSEMRYSDSRSIFESYFKAAEGLQDLPLEASQALAHYTQGYNFIRQENYRSALGHFERSIRSAPQSNISYINDQMIPDAYTRSGDCYFKLNDYSNAIAAYNVAIDNERYRSIYATFQKAVILGLLNQPYDKVVLLDWISDEHKSSQYADDALFELADTYQMMQSTDKAIPALRQLIVEHPNSEFLNKAYLRLGLISFNNGDLVSAIDNYKSVFDHNPSPTEAREALAALEEIYVQDLAQPDDYFAFAETVPGFEVSNFRRDSVSYRTAEIQYENAEYKNAIASFQSYLDKFPTGTNRLNAQYYSGESHAILKQYDEALSDYDSVLDFGASRYYQKALSKSASISYHHNEDFGRAYGYYERLEQITSDTTEKFDAQLGMLRSAYRMGNWASARAAGTKVLKHSEVAPAERAEAHYAIGKSTYESGDLDAALKHFNEVTKLSNNLQTAEARILIPTIYIKRGQLDIAEQMVYNANSENVNYPNWVARGLMLLSDIYLAKGDFFNAKAPLEAIVENFEGDQAILEEAQAKLATVLQNESDVSRLKTSTDTLEMDKNNDNGNW